jgi:glucose-1-phosphate thymidylyltransferase
MHAVVLAGGFAKRMWPLTKERPKPLLDVGGKPIIEHILERVAALPDISRIFVTTNQKFRPHFEEWMQSSPHRGMLQIVTEPTMTEEQKLGAVGALASLLREKSIDDDLLVVAGDNLFDFDVREFIACGNYANPTVALYDIFEKEKVAGRFGCVVLDEESVIKEFHEKPEQPPSTLISTGCYFFPKSAVSMIHDYLSNGHNPDAPGFFISWLSKKIPVHGFIVDGENRWFDIGSFENLEDARKAYGRGD